MVRTRQQVRAAYIGRTAYLWTIPRRAASAAASPRVGDPELARIAETWCSTVLLDRNSRSAISRVAQALGDQREDFELARGEPGGVLPGRRARAARQTPRSAALAQRGRPRAARPAPRRCSSSSLAAAPLHRGRRARAPTRTDSRSAVQSSAASSCSPASSRRVRLGDGIALDGRRSRHDRARRELADGPVDARLSSASTRSVSATTPRSSPASHAPRRARRPPARSAAARPPRPARAPRRAASRRRDRRGARAAAR